MNALYQASLVNRHIRRFTGLRVWVPRQPAQGGGGGARRYRRRRPWAHMNQSPRSRAAVIGHEDVR